MDVAVGFEFWFKMTHLVVNVYTQTHLKKTKKSQNGIRIYKIQI